MRYGDLALLGKALTMELDAFDLVQRLCFHVAFAAMGTGHRRNILYNKDVFPLAVCPGNPAKLSAFFPADFTYHGLSPLHTKIMADKP